MGCSASAARWETPVRSLEIEGHSPTKRRRSCDEVLSCPPDPVGKLKRAISPVFHSPVPTAEHTPVVVKLGDEIVEYGVCADEAEPLSECFTPSAQRAESHPLSPSTSAFERSISAASFQTEQAEREMQRFLSSCSDDPEGMQVQVCRLRLRCFSGDSTTDTAPMPGQPEDNSGGSSEQPPMFSVRSCRAC
eukprot:TRINITY_DN63882_c0_g1_i1.p1 TRINITY_DN63882_c0_g1~~TRINITY_DN63882_c0_g1_i1.p1  ORF type:complete len:191 (+),score=15.49 TRINITY_DN63882_c0_g1_i1:76-648(+)